MREYHILFTGVGRRVELLQAFRDAALSCGLNLKLYGADMAGTAPALAFCDAVCLVPAMRDPAYIPALLELCKSKEIDLVIPTIDTDLLVLSENRARFAAQGTRVMISSPQTVGICRNKVRTAAFFAENGFHTPVPVTDWREYKGGWPAFIKPVDGSSSIDSHKVGDLEELIYLSSKVENYLIQPFIRGREYTVDAFCDWDGEPLLICPRERLQVRTGEVIKTRIELDPRMIREAAAVCRLLRPCGPVTIQLIRDEAGEDWFIEINPRYGGGAPLSMKAGARSAEVILRLLAGMPLPEYPILDGAIYSRFDQSVCISGGLGTVKGVIFDLDDTLYPEKDYVRSGFRAVARYLDRDVEDFLWQAFSEGKPAIDALAEEFDLAEDKTAILEVYRSHTPEIRLFDGAAELLTALREKGCKLGVITDGRPEGQRKKLAALGLDALVDDVLITDELGGEAFRKPCDIAFRILQRRWGLPFENLLYVGDNPAKDFQAIRQLGMHSVCVTRPDGLYVQEACTVDRLSPEQLRQRLLEE